MKTSSGEVGSSLILKAISKVISKAISKAISKSVLGKSKPSINSG
jgi:hypothetical protein